MRTVPVSEFMPTLRQLVSVVLPMQLEQAIVASAVRFCRGSGVVMASRTFCQVYEGQTINIVRDSAVNRRADGILKASDSALITSDGVALQPDRDYHALSLDDVFFLRDAQDVTITCTVEPVLGAKELPAKLYDDWLSGICAGAAARLYAMPDSLDPNLHAHYEREFVETMRQAMRWRLETSPSMSPSAPVRKREFF
ncbi:hypothetical protein [Enterovibrio sp. 27052020O]|uniref:hypothetical protein n=1 Tax=Enterovibrio sp. 27052020O TaxID=3241166 RepID=UPI00388D5C49